MRIHSFTYCTNIQRQSFTKTVKQTITCSRITEMLVHVPHFISILGLFSHSAYLCLIVCSVAVDPDYLTFDIAAMDFLLSNFNSMCMHDEPPGKGMKNNCIVQESFKEAPFSRCLSWKCQLLQYNYHLVS